MTTRTLTRRDRNRALLARQLLLERADLPVPEALEAVAGLQTQYAPSGYIGLWSRLRDFERDRLTSALVDRTAIQGTLMRSTIHMVSARDFPLFAAGTRRARMEWWLRATRSGMTPDELGRIGDLARDLLRDGPIRQEELRARLEAEGVSRIGFQAVAQVVDFVRVPPSGTWDQRRANLYGLADTWLDAAPVEEADGIVHLVRRYLAGFGPATRHDIASWAGLPVSWVAPVLASLDLRRFRDEDGRELVDLPDAPLPDGEVPAPVRYIGTWEACLLVHARRTAVLPEAYRPRIFHIRAPHSFPTFLVDGAVAGTWRYEQGRITREPFHELPAAVRRQLDDEAEALAAFHA